MSPGVVVPTIINKSVLNGNYASTIGILSPLIRLNVFRGVSIRPKWSSAQLSQLPNLTPDEWTPHSGGSRLAR